MTALSMPDGTPFRLRAEDAGDVMSVLVAPPSSPRERAMMHFFAAKEAERQRNQTAAVEEYRLAALAEPGVSTFALGLAAAYVSSARYEEAYAVYNDVLRRFAANRELVRHASELLAFAQISAGAESAAAETLRRSGATQDRIDETLQRHRAEAAAREKCRSEGRAP